MRSAPAALISRRLALLACCVGLAVVVACEGSTGSPRPSPSLVDLDFTPRPTSSSVVTPSTTLSPSSAPSWPVGWDAAFCEMFAEAVIAQELIVDVERALDERARRDARGLARELGATATNAAALIAAVPDWAGGQDALVEIAALMDLGARAGPQYEKYLRDDARAALRRARNLRDKNQQGVPKANAELEQLAQAGLSCPGLTLLLESP